MFHGNVAFNVEDEILTWKPTLPVTFRALVFAPYAFPTDSQLLRPCVRIRARDRARAHCPTACHTPPLPLSSASSLPCPVPLSPWAPCPPSPSLTPSGLAPNARDGARQGGKARWKKIAGNGHRRQTKTLADVVYSYSPQYPPVNIQALLMLMFLFMERGSIVRTYSAISFWLAKYFCA